jgi:DNA-binding MarR family transcriptional regulator
MELAPTLSDATSTSNSPADFNGGFMHTIHLLYFTVQKRVEQVLLARADVSFSQFLILAGFTPKDCPYMTQARLAEYLHVTEATVSRHITSLVAKGLLSKEKDPTNKKTFTLLLTNKGQKAFSKAKTIAMQELDNAFITIKDSDKKRIIKIFSQTITSLQTKK